MKTTIKKWGNSAAIRIPAMMLRAISVDLEDEVVITEEKGRIVIKPTGPKKYELNDLLKGITEKNQHEVIDFGEPQGKEVW